MARRLLYPAVKRAEILEKRDRMKDGKNLHRMRSYLIYAVMAAVILGGCQKGGISKPSPQWICDEKADTALQTGDLESGIRLNRRILEKDPHNALAWYHLGYAYGQTGNHQLELACYEKAASAGYNRDPDLFYNLGMAYGELNRVPEAVSAFKTAVALNPESPEYHFGLGLAYTAGSDGGSAEREFLEAISIDSDHAAARFELSLLYVDSGKLPKARDQLKKILETNPSHQNARELLNRIGVE